MAETAELAFGEKSLLQKAGRMVVTAETLAMGVNRAGAPMDLLPEYLWGAPVLIFSEEGEELTVLPEGDPNDTGTSSTMTVKLDKDGAAAITLVSATKNSRAWGIKEKIPQLSRMQLQGFLQIRMRKCRR